MVCTKGGSRRRGKGEGGRAGQGTGGSRRCCQVAAGDVVVMALSVRPVGVTDCVAHAMLCVCAGVCVCM